MNRSCCAFLLVNLVLLICRFDLQSQPATRHYTCFRTLTGITIDGNLSDPAWRDIPWSEPFTDIEGAIRPTPPLETRMKMTWDDSCLYIGARLIEPHLFATLTQRDDLIYYDPDFEVFVDPDGDALNYYEFEINALGTEMDLFMNRSYKNGGKYNLTHLSYANEAERSSDVVTASFVDDELRESNMVKFQCLKSRDHKPFADFYSGVLWPCRRIFTMDDVTPQQARKLGDEIDLDV